MKTVFFFCILPMLLLAQDSYQIKIDIDGREQGVTFSKAQAFGDLKNSFAAWLPEAERKHYLIFQGSKPLTETWQDFSLQFVPEKTGQAYISVRGSLRHDRKEHSYTLYKNFVADGCELKNGDLSEVSNYAPAHWEGSKGLLETTPEGNILYGTHDRASRQKVQMTAGQTVTLTFSAKAGVTLPSEKFPVAFPAPVILEKRAADSMPKEFYSYYDDEIKLLPLAHKGISGDSVVLRDPERQPKRPCPTPLFTEQSKADKPGTLDYAQIKLELLEEAGTSRQAPIRVGVPMPRAALFSLKHLRLLAPDGTELPGQFTITAFWPDASIKWVLVQFQQQLQANERQVCTLEVGQRVQSSVLFKTALSVQANGAGYTVKTARLEAAITPSGSIFTIPGRRPYQLDNLVLRNEQNEAVSFRSASLNIEEQGLSTMTLRQEGTFGTHAAAVIRYRFHSGSAKVFCSVHYLNNDLSHEFSDISSLIWPLRLPEPCAGLSTRINGNSENFTAPARLFQKDDQLLSRNGAEADAQMEGSLRLQLAGGALGLGLRDAVWRYPKAFSVAADQVLIEILPDQGDPTFGKHLPAYLRFPFLEGKYRMKWGMGFSENIFFDFSGNSTLEQISAATQLPVLAVVDRDWYFRCQVIQGASPNSDHSFDEYDRKVDQALEGHWLSKAAQREYGFLNYGDWYGERGHNWGNNEYDLAHGMFVHFMRSGNRKAARLATLAAQHQADVDIVRAYKDPYYLGGNAEHSVGHTGVSYQIFDRATWTYRYDYSFSAENGHNWAQGMVNEWQMHGNASVMQSAIMLGEHINNYMAPNFKVLGNHERSAGWSLKSIIALYTATSDPEYLESARLIITVPLREQNFKDGGAWPHVLPAGHNGGHKNTYGNCTFLIGVLMEGMVQFHRETGDPDVAKSLTAASEWLKCSFIDEEFAWPYASSIEGKAYNQAAPGLNMLIAPAAIYVANLNQDRRLFDIASMAMGQCTFTDMDTAGKALSMDLGLISGLLDGLAIWNRNNPSQPYRYNQDEMLRKFMDPRKNAFNLRGPDHKVFGIRLKQDNPQLQLTRRKHGARPNFKSEYTLQISTAKGTILHQEKNPTLEPLQKSFPLLGRAGDLCTVTIDDDMTAVWTIPVSDEVEAWVELAPNTTISCRTRCHYCLQVPAGTRAFTVTLSAIHPGSFGGVLATADGKVLDTQQGSKIGKANLPWLKASDATKATLVLSSGELPPGPDGHCTLTVWASGDIGVAVDGIPARLSLVPITP
ncbi:MAG: hypothetical protein WCT05_09835 [Lentisphaeria bacterium]